MNTLIMCIISFYEGRNLGVFKDRSWNTLKDQISEVFPECMFQFVFSDNIYMYVFYQGNVVRFQLFEDDLNRIQLLEVNNENIECFTS